MLLNRRTGPSQYKGVTVFVQGTHTYYRAQISRGRTPWYLGQSNDEQKAALLYDRAALLSEPWARSVDLNFPELSKKPDEATLSLHEKRMLAALRLTDPDAEIRFEHEATRQSSEASVAQNLDAHLGERLEAALVRLNSVAETVGGICRQYASEVYRVTQIVVEKDAVIAMLRNQVLAAQEEAENQKALSKVPRDDAGKIVFKKVVPGAVAAIPEAVTVSPVEIPLPELQHPDFPESLRRQGEPTEEYPRSLKRFWLGEKGDVK
jgi:hypothetical protein